MRFRRQAHCALRSALPALLALVALVALVASLPQARAGEITPAEARWLQGMLPVMRYARTAGLPVDVIVQPQPAAGEAPLALAFIDGRCKLVLTLRGNADAQRMLEAVEPGLRDAVLELMAAHELGHCLRHVDGRWHLRPADVALLAATAPSPPSTDEQQVSQTRLEEGFADLAGLAWVRHARPAQYARLHGWLLDERSHGHVPGTHHDTLAWLRLAADGAVFDGGATPFERVTQVWQRGLPTDAAQAAVNQH